METTKETPKEHALLVALAQLPSETPEEAARKRKVLLYVYYQGKLDAFMEVQSLIDERKPDGVQNR